MDDSIPKIKEIIKEEMTNYKAKILALSLKKKDILSKVISDLEEQKITKIKRELKK